jgi:biopolymer transport protein ExbD
MLKYQVLVCVGLSACLVSPVMHFGAGKSAKEAQHDTMAEFSPARLGTDEHWQGEIATKKVRVWADNQYRTQNIHWQDTFEESLELTNSIISQLLGVRLVPEYAVWDRDVPGATLTDSIKALQEQDPGDDVFVVIGLTSSLPLVSATFDELGLAMVDGRHLIVRGYADLEERKMYANAFPDLRREERELALDQLRRHKTAVVLLHELGHIFGVRHETDMASIMSSTYSNHAALFSDEARATMLHSVDERLHRGSTVPVMASAQPVAAPVVTPAVVEKPKPVVVVHHDPVVIRVTKKRETIVKGRTLSSDELAAHLKVVYAEDPTAKIIINEDRNVPTGFMSELIERLNEVGFARAEFKWSGK